MGLKEHIHIIILMPLIPAFKSRKQEDFFGFETSLLYVVRFRTVRTT